MREIDTTFYMIGAYLEQLSLLTAQPEVDAVAVDNVMWKILGLALDLDGMYEERYLNEIAELEAIETITIRDELLKRERILEASRIRASVLENLFDPSIVEQKELYDLFEDIRKKQNYESVYHDAERNLVKEQIDLVSELKVQEQLLKEEYENNILKTKENESKLIPFEQFNNELKEEYRNFIEINEIDKIDIDRALATKSVALERQSVVAENIRLLETAQNIDASKFKHLGERFASDKIIIEESNELVFMAALAPKMCVEANSYEELKMKTEDIANFVLEREDELLAKYPNINNFNEITYRTIYFDNDFKLVNDQINMRHDIERLKNRNIEIEEQLENLYNNVKGKRELENVIYDRPQEVAIEVDKEEQIETPQEVAIEVDKEEQIETPQEELVTEEIVNTLEEPIMDGEILEVTKVEKASNYLLAKIKNVKNKLLSLANRAAPFILAGSILMAPLFVKGDTKEYDANINVPAIESEYELENATPTPMPIMENDELEDKSLSLTEELTAAIESLEENHSNSVGDKVSVESGTKYYRDSISAQLDNNSFEAGRSTHGLRPQDYNVNRIAILEKDALGNPTGKVLGVTATPTVSAEEFAEYLGVEPGQYEVMIHIAEGDENGNYIEASTKSASVDDLCWVRADDPGVKIVAPASEILNNIGKGISR